ncbi:MAG: pirin family protein [Pseudomonadota bacterium]
MFGIKRAHERGVKTLDWLDARYSFSHADYYNPRSMGFGALRALNEYRVQPGGAFDTVDLSDLEIVTYVTEGALAHGDSVGPAVTLTRGDAHALSAGQGVRFTHRNASSTDEARFAHLWILPDKRGGEPRQDTRSFSDGDLRDRLCLIASPTGDAGSLTVNRKIWLHASRLSRQARIVHPLGAEREAWLQVLDGGVEINGVPLDAGDGAAIQDEETLELTERGTGASNTEILLVEMARDG